MKYSPNQSLCKKEKENNMARGKAVQNDEVESLKKQLAQMAIEIEKLSNSSYQRDNEISDDNDGGKIHISSDEYIKVMSLCPNVLNLSTQGRGKGKIFTFTKLYEVKRILYRDLVDIMENHTNFLNDGLFIILNPDVIKHHGLDDVYEKILTKEKIEDVLKGNSTDAVNLFKSANSNQQEIIAKTMIEEMVAGKEMDLNFVDRISRAIGYSLVERVDEIKKMRDIK
jgi:hypothetical protein